VTSCTSIILTYFHFNLEKMTKITLINGKCDSFFSHFAGCTNPQYKLFLIHCAFYNPQYKIFLNTLRVIQPAIQIFFLIHCGFYNPQYKIFFKYIADCITRNTKFFLDALWVVQPAKIVLEIV